MRLRLSSSIAIALLAWAWPARANPSARLVYVRGPGADVCPNEDAVRAAVTARLGYDPFFLSAPTTIFVEVSRDGNRFIAQVKLIDNEGVERGTRHLATQTGRCVDLIGTLALTISLVVDPVSLAVPPIVAEPRADERARAPDVPPAAPTPAPVNTPATAPEHPAASSPPRPEGASFFAGISVLGSLGSALAPTAGAAVFGGVRRGWLSVRVEGRADLPASAPDAQPARSWALVASTLPCVHREPVFACGVLAVESIQASRGSGPPRSAEALVVLAGGRLGGEVAIADGFAFSPFAEMIVPLERPVLQIDGATQRFSRVAGDVGVAGLVHFR